MAKVKETTEEVIKFEGSGITMPDPVVKESEMYDIKGERSVEEIKGVTYITMKG